MLSHYRKVKMISAANPAWQPICPLWLFSILFTKGKQVFRNQRIHRCCVFVKCLCLRQSDWRPWQRCPCSATANNMSIFNVPRLLSAFRALQQAIPTALPSFSHPIWPWPLQFYSFFRHQVKFLFPQEVSCRSKKRTSVPSLQFSHSVCPTLYDPTYCSTPGLPVHHQLPEFTQTHIHWVSDAIQPSHPLSSPSLSAFNLSQHQGLFQWVSSSQQVAKVLEFQLQHQSFQWTPRTDLL